MTKRSYSLRLERNLLAVWNRASPWDRKDGMSWYALGNEKSKVLAEKYHLPVSSVTGVIAALSPGRNWELNLWDAEEFIRAFVSGKRGRSLPKVGSYGSRNLRKSERICNGESPQIVLGGEKVRNFWKCLTDPKTEDGLCLDRHAKCAALGKFVGDRESVIRTKSEYSWLGRHYLKCSRRIGILPCEFQAVVWTTWRRLHGVLNQEDLPF